MTKILTIEETDNKPKEKAKSGNPYNFKYNDSKKQSELGKKGGESLRLKYKREKIDKITDDYYNDRRSKQLPPTWSGLARVHGFASRQDMEIASKDMTSPVSCCYRRALSLYDEYLEELVLTARNPLGSKFLLQNRGFKETQCVQTENKSITITVDSDIKTVISKLKEEKI